jgi:cation diffusion facilitator family transporter
MTLKDSAQDSVVAAWGPESRAALASLALATLMFAIKFGAYLSTGSSAIFSDALESVVGVLTGAFALYATQLAHRPADNDHPYGHGKIEFLSCGLEGGMIVLTAVLVVGRSVKALVGGSHVDHLVLGMWVMLGTTVITGATGVWLVRRGRRLGTIVLEAEGQHSVSDAITSLAAALALAGVQYLGWSWLDPAVALCVAIYLVWLALRLLRRSAAGLMDEQDVADASMLRRILDAHLPTGDKEPRICSYHKLRHRHSGRYHWVDFHMMVPRWWDIDRGHRIASTIEYEIECALGEGNATAHVEPCSDPACQQCRAEQPAMEDEVKQSQQSAENL